MRFTFAGFTILTLSFFSATTFANLGEMYGVGSRSAALAGAGVAWGSDAYWGYANPAALPTLSGGDGAKDKKRVFLLADSIVYMKPIFNPINGIVVENNYTSDKTRSADIDVNYRPTFSQALGLAIELSPEFHKLSLGITAILPVESLAYFDTGEAFVPEYIMYRARTQRPQIEVGLGFEPVQNLRFGLGLHVAYTLTSNATVFIQTGSGRSSMRFAAAMKQKAAPNFSVHYSDPSSNHAFTLGSVLRLPVASSNTMSLNSGAHIFPSLRGLDFNFNALSTLFYDPLTWQIGGSFKWLSFARAYLQVDYEAWSKFEAPALVIQNVDVTSCTGGGCGVIPSPGANPAFIYRDLWVPRIAQEFDLSDSVQLRMGYSYRKSMIEGTPTGPGNYLDPDKHIMSVGAGFKFDHLIGLGIPAELDLHASYHHLPKKSVTKTAGNEGGDATDQKIGSPGYTYGGRVIGGGATVTLHL